MRFRVVMRVGDGAKLSIELEAGEYALGPSLDADVYAPIAARLELGAEALLVTTAGDRLQLTHRELAIGNMHVSVVPQHSERARTQSMGGAATPQRDTPQTLRLSHGQYGDHELGNVPFRIGSDISNDLVLNTTFASKFHCEIFVDQGSHWIRDLNSKNGIKLDGRRTQLAEISGAKTLTVADVQFDVVTLEVSAAGPVQQSAAMKATLQRMKSVAETGKGIVCFAGPPGSGRRYLARLFHQQFPRGMLHTVRAADLTEANLRALVSDKSSGRLLLEDLDLAPAAVSDAVRALSQSSTLGWLATCTGDAFLHRSGFVTVRVPSLQQRVEDILPLAEQLLGETLPNSAFGPDARAWFLEHGKELSARQLRQLIRRAALQTRGNLVLVSDLGVGGVDLATTERQAIVQAISDHGGNMSKVAEALGIARSTLYRKLDEHRISRRT